MRGLHLMWRTLLPYALMYGCDGQNLTDAKALHTSIFSSYNKNVRPVTNQSRPVIVSFQLMLFKIVETDEPTGLLCLCLGILNQWQDDIIRWTPASYGGIETISVYKSNVWHPEYAFATTVDYVERFGDDSFKFRYNYSGQAQSFVFDVTKVSCSYDESKYPFDEHDCEFLCVVVGYDSTEVQLDVSSTEMDLTQYQESSQWLVSSTSMKPDSDIPGVITVKCRISIKRRERYFMFVKFIPILLMSFLNVLVFKLPVDAGERVGFSITCLLSFAVFLTDITTSLPTGSTNMAYIYYLLSSLIVISSIICGVTIVTVRLYHRDDDVHISSWLQRIVLFTNCRLQAQSHRVNNFVHRADQADNISRTGENQTGRKPKPSKSSTHLLNVSEFKKGVECSDVQEEFICMNWKDVSMCIDTFMIYACFILIVVFTTVYFIYITS